MEFHHIGIATNDIEKTILFVEKTFPNIKNITDIIYDDLQKANLCLITLSDDSNIELVSGEQVSTFLKKNIHLYHSCWEVENIQTTINKYIKAGSILISKPKEAVLFNNRKVAFLYTDIGIVELLEK